MESTVLVTFLVVFSILLHESSHHGVETVTVVHTSERTFPEKAAGVNIDLAGLIQKFHLQELFNRYGENNSLSIEGFRKLLQNIGIDKMKRIKIDHDHDHDHHHHNHVSSSKNSEKTICPNREPDANKDHRNSHSKEPHKGENVERQQNFARSKNTVSEITASIITTPTDSHSEFQSVQPGEVRAVARLGLTSPNASNVTGGSSTSWPGNSKANESHAALKEAGRGSYLYSKLKNQNTQEVRLILLCSQESRSTVNVVTAYLSSGCHLSGYKLCGVRVLVAKCTKQLSRKANILKEYSVTVTSSDRNIYAIELFLIIFSKKEICLVYLI